MSFVNALRNDCPVGDHKKVVKEMALAAVMLFLASCGEIEGQLWSQSESVEIGNADFKRCVSKAVASVNGLTIDAKSSMHNSIVAKVEIDRLQGTVWANIQRRENNKAEILLVGKGMYEPDQTRAALTPLLLRLAKSVNVECAGEKAVGLGQWKGQVQASLGGTAR